MRGNTAVGKVTLNNVTQTDLETKPLDIPKGDYLLALKWIDSFEARDGTMYWKCRYQIVSGPHQDQHIWIPISRDTSNAYNMRAWTAWAFAIGETKKTFDTDSKDDIISIFRGRVFKATIARTENDEKIFYRIVRRYFDLNESEKLIKAEWEKSFSGYLQQKKQDTSRAQKAAPAGDYGAFGDDDIPF